MTRRGSGLREVAALALGIGLLASLPGCDGESAPEQSAEQATFKLRGVDRATHRADSAAPRANCTPTDERRDAHDHDHTTGSDLDRSVGQLLAAECEHGMPTYTCDECRYEVGVAKVGDELISAGLVEIAEIGARSFRGEIEVPGEIGFDERRIAHLGPRATGIVREVHVDLGQRVAEGDVLVELDSVELGAAEADYLEALAGQRLAQRTFERQRELRAAEITSEREFLEAEQMLESATIRMNAERQRLVRMGLDEVELADLAAVGAAAATGNVRIRAPFAGEVLDLHAVRGEQIEAAEPILLLGDSGRLWIWIDIYEDQLAEIPLLPAEGIAAQVQVRACPGEVFSGTLDYVGGTMDEITRTVKARVTLENSSRQLRPGMFATVHLGIGSTERVLAVPAAGVLTDAERDFVFVRCRDDYFVRRPVTTGRRHDGFVEIRDGLTAGQTIATRGAFLLKSDVLRSKMGEGCAH